MKRAAAQHADWLNLVEPSGAFPTLPVLRRVFPPGLDRTPPENRAAVREALDTLTRHSRLDWNANGQAQDVQLHDDTIVHLTEEVARRAEEVHGSP
jgi:hypothetical protein